MATEGNYPFLPDDIILNILKRLPMKSLIRFQSVCKDWKNLFETPSFIADNLHHSHHNNPFLVLKHRRPRGNINFRSNKMGFLKVHKQPSINCSHARVVGSSNGLLCILLKDTLLLWNPANREVRYVSETIKYDRRNEIFGFGFSQILNDYKILRLCYGFRMFVDRVEVYSLSTNSWKDVNFGTIRRVRLRHETVMTNGTMFWLGEVGGRILVVSFDIVMEVFKLIKIPSLTPQPHNSTLVVYENKLALFHCRHAMGNFESSFLDMWVMEEWTDSSRKTWSWTKKRAVGPISGRLYPICNWKNEIIGRDFTMKMFLTGEHLVEINLQKL